MVQSASSSQTSSVPAVLFLFLTIVDFQTLWHQEKNYIRVHGLTMKKNYFLSLSHTGTHPLSHTDTHPLSHTQTHNLSQTHSLSHTQTPTLSHTQTQIHKSLPSTQFMIHNTLCHAIFRELINQQF